jgi:hypothetical protein
VDEGRTELARRFGTTLRIAGTGQHGMTQIGEPPGCLMGETLVAPMISVMVIVPISSRAGG